MVEQPVKIEGAVLQELYAAHAAEAARLAFLLTGDRALAEDLVQDAFVRVTGRLLHLRNQGAFPAYLRASIVNLVRSHARRAAVERRFVERSRDPGASTSHDRDAAEWQRMRDALLQLPVRQRTAIVLRFYEDLSEAQIADALRCRPGTVKSLISRGTERLRPLLAEEVR
ncbi:MAG: RNA polymerase sigma factor [Actinomycetota bacterium]